MSDSGATDPKTGRHAVVAAVGSRYHIQSKVGTGAFADVYEAHDAILDRTVAIKQFRLDNFAYPSKIEDLKKRILREAQVAAQLHHANIVTTHDIILTDERCVIVMEFVDGVTLEAILEKHGRLGLRDTIKILSQVAGALDHAHQHKVVHRDVKPANVMVSHSGDVKVTDFGIAKTETSTNLTASGSILGTPDYMSPEQARADHVDGRSDLFSLGCILYECLSGRKPFRGDGLTGVLLQIVNEEPEPLDCEKLELPVAVQAVLKNALAKDPLKRFASGREFGLALRSIPALESAKPSKVFFDANSAEELERKLPTKETTPTIDDSVADSLMKEARRTTQIEPHLRVLLREDRRLRLVSSPLLHFHNVSLTPEEAFILSRIDGTVTPCDVFKVSALSEQDTARTLLGLLRAGIIELDGTPTAKTATRKTQADQAAKTAAEPVRQEIERLFELFQQQDDWQVLGVDQGATPSEIKKAFQKKTFQFHPDRYSGTDDPQFHKKLSFLFTRVSEAFAALSNRIHANEGGKPAEKTASTSTENKDRARARSIFESARDAHGAQDYWQAVVLCREAIDLASDQAEYYHVLGLALAHNRKWRLEAEQNLKMATVLDPGNPEYLSSLGTLYEREGLRLRARTMFENATAVSGSCSMTDEALASFLFQDRPTASVSENRV
jgi:serine/threonine protein kinase